MADGSPSEVKEITFAVKSSNDQKFSVTVPENISVADLKTKLSSCEYADISADRQRLIYSGRVLKDTDTLSVYKIQNGNTVHMVKGAAKPAAGSASTPSVQQNPAAAGVPTNIASGTGGDPLANLTGARYAGFAQMPGANMFGPDGGMGAPPNQEDLLTMLDNPMFQSQMNEAMNNPDVIRMMSNNPMVQNNPFLRQALQNPEFRRMMMDPQVIRQSMQMSRMMGGPGGSQGAMPAPGVTDTTPGGQTQGQNNTTTSQPPQMNPFQLMGQGQGQGPNPFSALIGGMGMPPAGASTGAAATTTDSSTNAPGQNSSATQPNPFASLFTGGMMGDQQQQGQQQQQNNPLNSMMQYMQSDPAAMQQAMQNMQQMFGGTNQNAQGQQGQGFGAGAGGFNPFAMGGLGAPPAQQDTRPPEEQYAEQLRQLNDMGFYEFERNVRALRMAGGSVQGAVEVLLGGGV